MARIFVDLDEVLADFTKAALEIHGWTREQLDATRPRGVWDITSTLRLTTEEFWQPIHEAGEPFWTTIDLLPWATQLMDFIYEYGLDWYVITTPSEHLSSYTGKMKWLSRVFDSHINRCFINPNKHLLAKPGAILIDDKEENVRKFIAAGGDGIIFPSLGNSLHRLADDPVPYVKQMLGAKNALRV
jgi:5'(3')-deoxyribonucleotidase